MSGPADRLKALAERIWENLDDTGQLPSRADLEQLLRLAVTVAKQAGAK